MIPFSTLGERTDSILRYGAVYLVIALLLIANITAMPYPLGGLVKVPLILIVVYYWSIYRPTLLPPFVVFMMGITIDLLSAAPLGLNALTFLGLHWFISGQRSFMLGQSFIVIWFAFLLINASILCVEWIGYNLFQEGGIPITALLPEVLITTIAFPVVIFIQHMTHKLLPDMQMPLMRQSG